VLGNVDMNWKRRSVLAALSLVEQQTSVHVERSVL
jgi:hypothetical protein